MSNKYDVEFKNETVILRLLDARYTRFVFFRIIFPE